MRIKEEGSFEAVITNARTIEARYKENEHEIEIAVRVTLGQDVFDDHIYLGLENGFVQSGENTGKTYAQVTYINLANMGLPNNGMDLYQLNTLVGKKIAVYTKLSAPRASDGKQFMNCNLSNRKLYKEADQAAIAQLMQMQQGGGQQMQQPVNNQQQQQMPQGQQNYQQQGQPPHHMQQGQPPQGQPPQGQQSNQWQNGNQGGYQGPQNYQGGQPQQGDISFNPQVPTGQQQQMPQGQTPSFPGQGSTEGGF